MRGLSQHKLTTAGSWILQIGAVYLFLLVSQADAVTQFRTNNASFIKDPTVLSASLNLPTTSDVERLRMPARHLRIRASRSEKDERIDPVQIYVPRDQVAFRELVSRLSSPGRQAEVERVILEKIRQLGPTSRARVRIDLKREELKLFNLAAISTELAHQHHNVTISTQELAKNTKMRSEFLDQIKPFLTQDQRRRIAAKLRRNQDLILHKDLLPQFAQRMARRFVYFRGPNCFHASLAFHDQEMTRSPHFNVKEEPGYHQAMINYDELWRIINKNFYEVDPTRSSLKYGDMIVFFAVPQNPSEAVNFRWIRHTATYLFGSYTFSKGSKSPNTPYSIKTLQEEWATWQNFTNNLGVKIFRRNSMTLAKEPPPDLIDWIY